MIVGSFAYSSLSPYKNVVIGNIPILIMISILLIVGNSFMVNLMILEYFVAC